MEVGLIHSVLNGFLKHGGQKERQNDGHPLTETSQRSGTPEPSSLRLLSSPAENGH